MKKQPIPMSPKNSATDREIEAIKNAIKAWEGTLPPASLNGLAKEMFEKMSKPELHDLLAKKQIIS